MPAWSASDGRAELTQMSFEVLQMSFKFISGLFVIRWS